MLNNCTESTIKRNERKTLGRVIIFLYDISSKSGSLIQLSCIEYYYYYAVILCQLYHVTVCL